MCLHFQVRKAYRVTTLSSRKRVNRGWRYFYDTLASYLSLYIRPTDPVVGLRPATALRNSEKSACKYTAHNVTRAAAIQLE